MGEQCYCCGSDTGCGCVFAVCEKCASCEACCTCPKKHQWASNRAFTKTTGIKAVCMKCGAAKGNAGRCCSGKRTADAKEQTDG